MFHDKALKSENSLHYHHYRNSRQGCIFFIRNASGNVYFSS